MKKRVAKKKIAAIAPTTQQIVPVVTGEVVPMSMATEAAFNLKRVFESLGGKASVWHVEIPTK